MVAKQLLQLFVIAELFVGCLMSHRLLAGERYAVGKDVSIDKSATSLLLLQDHQAKIEAAIAPAKGGELSGLRIQHRGEWVETLYLARDYSPRSGWTGKAPLLWPATGRNFPADLEARQKSGERFNTGAYVWDGRRYEMPIHGFARELAWRVDRSVADERRATTTLTVSDTDETRKQYPFGFSISADYVLQDGVLSIVYRVHAAADNRGPLPFSIGNHITFVSPLLPGTAAGKMELVTPATTELLKTSYGLPTGKRRPRSHADGIQLGKFERLKAVSLTGYQGNPSIIYRDPQGLGIRMSHAASQIPDQPVVLFNIWGDVRAGFFSPEPWVGLQNSLVLNQGLVQLPPDGRFQWTIRIDFERT